MVTHNMQSRAFGARHAVAAPHGATLDPGGPAVVPEWMTEAWKHRVEAEARHRLKREIRGISSRR